jgi:hypothetical protein
MMHQTKAAHVNIHFIIYNFELLYPPQPTHFTPQVDDFNEIFYSAREWALFERTQMGDRTPSQFYRVLKRMSAPGIPPDFIAATWRNRLRMYIQQILASSNETDVEVLTRIPDQVYYDISAEGE